MVQGWLSFRQIHIFLYQCYECYTTLIVQELVYNKKTSFLILFQKVL